ncbi:unnamed protein product [Prorocentrum cordatum]|uniref:Calmodulin-lysine N-methyltransferase n=1 Tax=Prorocentrum cordatum TaxID=2364126 RepID=A0ABN9S504_9DINO|nr:unnamed protein product [Polarella glacialis]
MLRGALGLLRRPSGLLISVAFAAAARVLLLRRVAKEMGLELLLRVVPARSEKRLVALLAESFSGVPSVEQDADALASELWLDGLLYAAPLRGEPFISFERPPLPTPLVIRQESAKDRLGTSEDATGGLVWPSAHALSAHLCARPELVRGRRVVELGAGTGLVGLVAAALGAEEVVLTDLPSALPLLQENVTRNASACGGRARTATLSWGAAGAEDVLRSLGGRCHVVIGCEIVYQHDEVTSAALAETMSLLAGADGICLFAYEFREGLLGDFEFFDRVNERFNVEVESLAPYGFGAQQRSDDMDRLLYVYRPTSVA